MFPIEFYVYKLISEPICIVKRRKLEAKETRR